MGNPAQVSKKRREGNDDVQEKLKELIATLDKTLTHAGRLLRKIDTPTYTRISTSHRDTLQSAKNSILNNPNAEDHIKWFAKDPDNLRTSSHRFGNFGSMMAVSLSTAEGTDYHYDTYDDGMSLSSLAGQLLTDIGHMYSTILVLGAGGKLFLPELGYAIDVRPGDVVCFLASSLLHKLGVDRTNLLPGQVQTVFTIWTDRDAYQDTNPSKYASFCPV
jgi:hypothetical protein